MKALRFAWTAAIVAFVATVAATARGQLAPPDITITPRPVGSGARALGQSAFIAVADDATAASWNPAGLIQLERPEVSFVPAFLRSTGHFSSASRDIRIGRQEWTTDEINFMSVAIPFTVAGKDVVASLNYHQVYDFSLGLKFAQTIRGPTTLFPLGLKVNSEGAVSATSLAAGVSVTPSLSIGAALNLYGNRICGENTWQVKTRASGAGMLGGLPLTFNYANTETFDDFRGANVTLGARWDAWSKDEKQLTLGLVVHTPFTAHVDRKTSTSMVLGTFATRQEALEKFEMDFPLSVGAGANYRFSDAWSVSGDVQWTDWSKFEQRDRQGRRSSPVGGGVPGQIDDTTALRLGTEYLFFLRNSVLALRGGVFSEPRPALGNPMGIYGFSLGTGWSTKRFSLDFAYQCRLGERVSGRNLGLDRQTSFRIEEHWFVASVIVYF